MKDFTKKEELTTPPSPQDAGKLSPEELAKYEVPSEEPPKEAPKLSEAVTNEVPSVTPTVNAKHNVQIAGTPGEQQKYNFLAECICGWQGRYMTESEALQAGDKHVALNS